MSDQDLYLLPIAQHLINCQQQLQRWSKNIHQLPCPEEIDRARTALNDLLNQSVTIHHESGSFGIQLSRLDKDPIALLPPELRERLKRLQSEIEQFDQELEIFSARIEQLQHSSNGGSLH